MKLAALNLPRVTVLPLALLSLASCSTDNQEKMAQPTDQVVVMDTPGGAAIIETSKTSATVTAVDPAKRKVTLKLADGTTKPVVCGPDVVNFNQIKVGDHVSVTLTEEVAVFLGRGLPPSASGAVAVSRAPAGSMPAGAMTSTVQVTAKIVSIDAGNRVVTLALPDGTTKRVKVRQQIDLSGLNPGDSVTAQYTESMAIAVERP